MWLTVGARERDAVVLELDDGAWRLLAPGRQGAARQAVRVARCTWAGRGGRGRAARQAVGAAVRTVVRAVVGAVLRAVVRAAVGEAGSGEGAHVVDGVLVAQPVTALDLRSAQGARGGAAVSQVCGAGQTGHGGHGAHGDMAGRGPTQRRQGTVRRCWGVSSACAQGSSPGQLASRVNAACAPGGRCWGCGAPR